MATTPIQLSGGDYGGQTIDWDVDDAGNPVLVEVGTITAPDGKVTKLMGKAITDAAGTWAYTFAHPGDSRAFLTLWKPGS